MESSVMIFHTHISWYAGNPSGKTEPADIIKLPSVLGIKQLLFALLGVQNNTLSETEVSDLLRELHYFSYFIALPLGLNFNL